MRERPFATAPVTLNVAVGPPNGPPMVLLHGVTRRWQDFSVLFPSLTFDRHVHAIDFRGHGRSGRTPGSYRVRDYVPDIVAYLRQAIESPAIVVGHSLGGMVAAAVAAEAPERVRALVLEDPTFEMTGRRIDETSFPDLFRAFLPHAGSSETVVAISSALAESPIRVPGRAEPVRLGQLRDAVALRTSASCLKRLDPDVLTAPLAGRWLEGFDVPTVLARVRCPTLLLQGDFALGGALPDAYGAELAGALHDVAHLKLTGIGHNIHGTQPEAMLRLMLPFLDSLD
jgi:pimeloyl-ACP methyl ester carboxylesterase